MIAERRERLYLFDIDGTLMRGTGPHHADALVEAIRRVTGVASSMDGIPVHGMLDPDILAEMMAREGIGTDAIQRAMPEVIRIAQEIYLERCPDLRGRVLPGVREVLASIAAPVGLVTGNLTQIGWTKVAQAGLRPHFQFGAFAEMARTRTDLARLAYEMAGAGAGTRVTMIGDAPSDVRAAKANGFRMVAVATGMTSAEELADLGADLVLTDLSQPADRARLLE